MVASSCYAQPVWFTNTAPACFGMYMQSKIIVCMKREVPMCER